MTETDTAREEAAVAYSRYSAHLVKYLMEHPDEVGDRDMVEVRQVIGWGRTFDDVPENMSDFYTDDFRAKVEQWWAEMTGEGEPGAEDSDADSS